MTSGINAKGARQAGFVYVAEDDVYLCPAGEQLTYCCTNEEDGKTLSYWTTACGMVNPLSGLPCAWTGFLFAAITAVTFQSQYSIFFQQIEILPELHFAANLRA